MNKNWNTLVKCVRTYPNIDKHCEHIHNFQEGHIYEIKNGYLIDGKGHKSIKQYNDIETLNDSFYAIFKEVKDEESC